MKFLIMTDIEGVTGVTTYEQAEKSQLGRDMLMNDLLAVVEGIYASGNHDIVIYDMHTDGRNIDMSQLPETVQVVMGKPINGNVYRGVGGNFDGLFLIGLHAMSKTPGALLAHSYLIQYNSIHINGELVGEIGVEALLAGEQGIPLLFVSGDDKGCEEAEKFVPGVVTVIVKKALDEAQALCFPPAKTKKLLRDAAIQAVKAADEIQPKVVADPINIKIQYSECHYLQVMKKLNPEIFTDSNTVEINGQGLLKTWSKYLTLEKGMVANA